MDADGDAAGVVGGAEGVPGGEEAGGPVGVGRERVGGDMQFGLAEGWPNVIGEEERIGGIAELESDGGAGAEGDVGEGAAGIGTDAAEDVEAAGGRAEADGGIKSERAGGSGGEEGVEGMKGVGAWHGDTIRKGRAGANLSATTRVDAMA
jgi:hypothetical protein